METTTSAGTARLLVCPQCSRQIPGDSRICPNCGVDFAMLALLAERAYLDGFPETAPIHAPPEALVPRLGEYLIQQGLITQQDLEQALQRQKETARSGERLLLGQTLLAMGLVDRETLDRTITSQIIELHGALQEANRTLERRVSERTKELRQALSRLRELHDLKANLISNVSHELRTPLAHVKGYLELLADQQLGPMTPEQQKSVEVMLRGASRLERLIDDLISFSTASREGLSLKREPTSIAALADQVVVRSREKAEKAGVNLLVEVAEALPQVQADQEKLGWVLFQLVDNGIKFTPAGGSVTVLATAQDGLLAIAVTDTGIGIPEERIEEIFEPFHQLDGSPTRRYGGTGLGLTLVRQILEAHGASVKVESAENQGSTFRFSLPLEVEGS
ncbi:MAG TPA: ATP-binding protein [Anaerolineales bacterium]